MVPSPKLGVQGRSDPPSEQQPPRGACRKCGARPLPTANVAGGINALICPTSIELSASPYVVHGQRSVRWITSLASGSSCWGPNEVAGRGPRHTPPPSPQIALKWCATQRPRLSPFMSVTARRSEDTCDDIVVSAYEED